MKKVSTLRSLLVGLVASAALLATHTYGAELTVDIAVKVSGKVIHASSVDLVMNEKSEVKVGDMYELAMTAALFPDDKVRFTVVAISGPRPMSVVATTKIGKPAKLLPGRQGDREIELTPRLKE